MSNIIKTIHAVALAAAVTSFTASGATVLYDGFDLDGAYAFTTTTNAGVFTVIGDSDTPNVAPIAAGKNGGTGFTGGWLRWDTLSGGANNTSNLASLVRMSVQNLSLGYVDGSGNILDTAVGGLRRFTRLGSPLGSDGIQNLTSYRRFWTNGVTGPATGDTVYFSFIIAMNNPIAGKWSLNNGVLSDTPAIAFGNSDASATGDVTVNMFDANGTMVGITRGTTKAHLARAVVEAMAYQTADVVDAMTAASGARVAELRVDGGASRMDLLCRARRPLAFVGDCLAEPAG